MTLTLLSTTAKRRLPLLAVALTLALGGCDTVEEGITDKDGEREIYEKARRMLEKRYYDTAISYLEHLENQYPFGPYAEQAQLELIHTLYVSTRYDEAAERAERFTTLHPAHPQVDYAHYISGLAAYVGELGLLRRVFNLDPSARDLSGAKEALRIFDKLLKDHPDTRYADEVRLRMVHLRNLLARHETLVANYYLRRQNWLSAVGRARFVVENFVASPAMADALAIMVYAYRKMEMADLAADALLVLSSNYPDYPSLDARGEFLGPPKVKFGLWYKLGGNFFVPEPPLFDARRLSGS